MKIIFPINPGFRALNQLVSGSPVLANGTRDVEPLHGKAHEVQSLQEVLRSIGEAAKTLIPDDKKTSAQILLSDLPETVEVDVKGAALDAIQRMVQSAVDSFDGPATALAALLESAKALGIDISIKAPEKEGKDA